VRRRLQDALATARLVSVEAARGLARDVSRSGRGLVVTLEDSGPIQADAVILATGYGPGFRNRGLGADPYGPLDSERLRRAARVVCVGSGLTMVDAVISLRCAGFPGEIVALSRRGLLPGSHARQAVPLYREPIVFKPTSLSIARAVRR